MRHLIKYMAATVILLLTAALPIQAQEDNAAFYIYQNDGRFAGFFYDEVQKISYSKIDTLGVEHDILVSQEIVTTDSTYRFMLSDIDSVSFVQPEIIFNPHLRDIRKEGIYGHLKAIEDDGHLLTFSEWLPEEKRPKVGDVLMDWDFEEGFCVKVVDVMVSNITHETIVDCEPIEDMREVFQQFITVEEYGKNAQGDLVRRRVAGMPEMSYGDFSSKRSSGEYEFNLWNFSLAGHIPLIEEPNCQIFIDPSIQSKLTVKCEWDIPMWGPWYAALTFTLNSSAQVGITLDATLRDSLFAGLNNFGQLPLPAAAPIFVVNFGPDGFMKSEIHAKASLQSPKASGRLWAKLEFKDHWVPYFNKGCGAPPDKDGNVPDDTEEVSEANKASASIEFSGFVHCGLMFPMTLQTNKWLSKFIKSEIGMKFFVGPKFSATFAVDVRNSFENGDFDFYGNYKDTRLTLSLLTIDFEAKALAKTFFSGTKETTLAEGSMSPLGDLDLYLFPDFKIEATAEPYSASHGLIKAQITPSRKMLFSTPVGVGIYTDSYKTPERFQAWSTSSIDSKTGKTKPPYYQTEGEWINRPSYNCEFIVKPGDYEVRPVFKFLGVPLNAAPVVKVKVPGAYLELDGPDSLFVKGTEHTDNVKIKTNCKLMTTEVLIVDYANRDTSWIHPVATDSLLIIKCDRNPNLLRRKAKVALTGHYIVNNDTLKITRIVYVEQGSDVKYMGAKISMGGAAISYPDGFLPCTTRIENDTIAYITVDTSRNGSVRYIYKVEEDSITYSLPIEYQRRIVYWAWYDCQGTVNNHYKSEIVLNLNTQSIVRIVGSASGKEDWLTKYYQDENRKSGNFKYVCDYQVSYDGSVSYDVLPAPFDMGFLKQETGNVNDKQYKYDTFRSGEFDSGKIKSYSGKATVTSNQGYGGVHTYSPAENLYFRIELLTDHDNYQNAITPDTFEYFSDFSNVVTDKNQLGFSSAKNKWNFWE